MSSRLIKRIYYGVQMSLDTPVCVSSGGNDTTDKDVLKDWEGRPFIPGTSLAGAFRSFLESDGENADVLFGSADETEGKMSRIWVSDFRFDEEVTTAIRDGVKLKNRIAIDEKKYDYEVIEYGSGMLYIQVCIWDTGRVEEITEEKAEEQVKRIIGGIYSGDIRIGAQKNRGLGKLKVAHIYRREFSKENAEEWISFDRKTLSQEKYRKDIQAWCVPSEQYVTIQVPLRLTGGLSIRKYSTEKNGPDFVSLMRKSESDEEKAVIPGSSWKGAIRSRIEEILQELGVEGILRDECKQIFGFVEEKSDREADAKPAEWMISESILKTDKYVQNVRNSVSRFENATIQTALFTERFAVEGTTELEIKIRKDRADHDWFIALLLLAVRDIQNGYLSVGGGAAVGRGIFASDGEKKIKGGLAEKEYMLALHRKLEGKV